MRKRKIIPIGIIVLVIIAAGLWYLNRPQRQTTEIVLFGNVDIRQVSLAFNASERVADILAHEGDAVVKGQVLARLDTEILRLNMEQTKAQIAAQEQALLRLTNGTRPEEIEQYRARLQSAQARVNLSAQEYQRLSSAAKASGGQAVSAQSVDEARAQLQVAEAGLAEIQQALNLAVIGPRAEDIAQARAQLQGLRAQLALQEHQLTLAELKSPTNAVVRSRLLEPGDMASPQRPVFLLALTSPKWVRAYVREADLGYVRPGGKALVTIDSRPNQPLTGQIGYISDVAEFTPKTVQTEELRTALLYEIRIYVDDPDNVMRMGMPATVTISRDNNGN